MRPLRHLMGVALHFSKQPKVCDTWEQAITKLVLGLLVESSKHLNSTLVCWTIGLIDSCDITQSNLHRVKTQCFEAWFRAASDSPGDLRGFSCCHKLAQFLWHLRGTWDTTTLIWFHALPKRPRRSLIAVNYVKDAGIQNRKHSSKLQWKVQNLVCNLELEQISSKSSKPSCVGRTSRRAEIGTRVTLRWTILTWVWILPSSIMSFRRRRVPTTSPEYVPHGYPTRSPNLKRPRLSPWKLRRSWEEDAPQW